MQHFTPKRDDRASLKALLSALDASETALRRDPPWQGTNDGDWAIWGLNDHDGTLGCHVYPDCDGYLFYFTVTEEDCGNRQPSSRSWQSAKAKLAFCQVTQDGDWESCLRLDRLPSPHEAKAIRDVLNIRKRRSGIADPTPLLRAAR
jgi:hypothetical protein